MKSNARLITGIAGLWAASIVDRSLVQGALPRRNEGPSKVASGSLDSQRQQLQDALQGHLVQNAQAARLSCRDLSRIAATWINRLDCHVTLAATPPTDNSVIGDCELRLIVWRNLPTRRLETIISSEVSKSDAARSHWFARMRAIFVLGNSRPDVCWLFGEATTVGLSAARLAQRYRHSWRLIRASSTKLNLWHWWSRLIDEFPSAPSHAAWMSPAIGLQASGGVRARRQARGWLDRWLVALSQAIWPVVIRPQGAVDRAVEERLAWERLGLLPQARWYLPSGGEPIGPTWNPGFATAQVTHYSVPQPVDWIAIQHDESGAKSRRHDLRKIGEPKLIRQAVTLAVPRTMQLCHEVAAPTHSQPRRDSFESRSSWADGGLQIVDRPRGDYLLHWTRANLGRWPDQTETQFFDAQLWRDFSQERTPLQSLQRIIQLRRILGTSRLTSGDVSKVSFTAKSLLELIQLRTYRRHLRRWDAEPYGIGIRTAWLQSQGARPVIYGTSSLAVQLGPEERLFFQPVNAMCDTATDWTREQEWRMIGDVGLELIDPDAVFVFVAWDWERQLIQAESPWPVYSMELMMS